MKKQDPPKMGMSMKKTVVPKVPYAAKPTPQPKVERKTGSPFNQQTQHLMMKTIKKKEPTQHLMKSTKKKY